MIVIHFYPTDHGKVRLVGGETRCSGRVEVYYKGEWGTVCYDNWGLSTADVVCRQLGCGHAVWAPGISLYGAGTGKIWLDNVHCSGSESYLWQCKANNLGQHDCGHSEDAGASCSGWKSKNASPELIVCIILGLLLAAVSAGLIVQRRRILLSSRKQVQGSQGKNLLNEEIYEEIDWNDEVQYYSKISSKSPESGFFRRISPGESEYYQDSISEEDDGSNGVNSEGLTRADSYDDVEGNELNENGEKDAVSQLNLKESSDIVRPDVNRMENSSDYDDIEGSSHVKITPIFSTVSQLNLKESSDTVRPDVNRMKNSSEYDDIECSSHVKIALTFSADYDDLYPESTPVS
ncbi:scavenger receptor cysteine-rich domain-containing protein SCART1-like [Latimeria chalumnae]|uniref:scavenger receptor cysteine-rich domain-containing protein SCART1-like n=1 Tax=Latimeria chalumnae TaxID=7897 RepID=UPI0006D903FA|nr:PREDICTED: scavenger receptor cysteine-rich domain-containing protein SCART1-like [Latimeria chalumnae]|eukprot:XP_014345330.1 PREDICTED: scavenger receptor cysteine-rich domain-containing protein SCART1-like [Latimeria chalumnae]